MNREQIEALLADAKEECLAEGEFDEEQLDYFIDKALYLYDQEW